ncbi:MAG: hypothetical protein QXH42_01635 [Thermoplasmata archaeon]
MRNRALAALLVGAVLAVELLIPTAGAGPAQDEGLQVTLHFKGQGFTTVPPSPGNTTEEYASAPGRLFGARRYGTEIGTWSFVSRQDFVIQGSFKAELWARSSEGAKNAGFRLNIFIGDQLVDYFFTSRQDVSSPVKFTITDSTTLSIPGGRTVGVGLVWLSDPNYFIGPSSGGDFLYGSADHDSFIVLTLSAPPLSVSLLEPEKEKSSIRLVASVNESLGMDTATLFYRLTVTGPASVSPDHISPPTISSSDNGTTVSWVWDIKKSKAQSGDYIFTVGASYDGQNYYTNSSRFTLRFEKEVAQGFFTNPTAGNNLFITASFVVIVAGVAIAGGFIALRRRKRRRLAKEIAAGAAPAGVA